MNKTLSLFDRRVRYVIAASLLMVSTVVIPALVSAAQITERSIALSNSSASAEDVSYQVNFTPAASAGAFVVDFCANSPVVGEACTAPDAGFTAAGAASVTAGFTDVSSLDANTIVVAGAMTASTPVTVDIDNINNPDETGALFARIVTYSTDAHADGYTSEDLDVVGAPIDDGGVAMSITDTIGVSGTVQESMTFCVSGTVAPEENCGGALDAPNVVLGEPTGGTVALIPTAVSEGSIFTQLSTNAASGAIVRIKSNTEGCGGLLRAGDPTACDILPALTAGTIANGEAKFGVRTATATAVGDNANGVLQPAAGSTYNPTNYRFNYVDGDATGVTSTYGDAFLDTADEPVNNQNMELTFGASVGNDTPAGTYSADLSMIATGKF